MRSRGRVMKRLKWTTAISLLVVIIGYNNCGKSTSPSGLFKSQGINTGNPFGPGPVAALPEVYLDSQFPGNSTGVTLAVPSKTYSDCQSAIDAANPGDTILISVGFVCSPIILRNKGASQNYIVIESAGLAALNVRAQEFLMAALRVWAVIESPTGAPAVTTELYASFLLVWRASEIRPGLRA